MASRWLLICVLGLCFTLALQQDSDPDAAPDEAAEAVAVEKLFDCTRPNIDCLNNGTCVDDTGLCTCAEGFVGLGCQYNETFVTVLCDECMNEGQCTDESGDTECICPEDKFGPKCQFSRVTLRCNPASMVISVAPIATSEEGFKGVLYIADQAADDDCYLQADPEREGSYTADFRLESCGGAANQTTDDGDLELTFSVVAQYNPLILTESDQVFNFVCSVRQDGGDQELDTSLVESDTENDPLHKQTVKEKLKPVTLTLLNAEGGQIVGTVEIGDIIALQYSLEGGDVYSSFKVMDLVASNGLTGDAEETMTFVRGGCVAEEAGVNGNNVVQDFTGDPEDKIQLLFKVFKFLRTSTLTFNSNVKLCKGEGNTTSCDFSECEEFDGVGRRRRSLIDTETEDYREYNTTLYIYHPSLPRATHGGLKPIAHESTELSMWSCLNQPGFVILIILLLVLLMVAIIVTAICCVRAAHAQAGDKC